MRILFTPYGGGSIAHIVRSLAVADALAERGHQILFTSPASKRSLVENAGYAVYGTGHPEVNLNDESDQSVDYFRCNHDRFVAWLSDEIAAAESFRPDIIVNSPTFFGPLASHKLGIPHVSIINAQWLVEFRGLLGLSKSRRRDYPLRQLGRPLFSRRFESIYMEEIRSFYRSLGVPYEPKRRHDLHRHYPVIIPGIPQFEPIERTARSDIHYVGPLFWKGFEKDVYDPCSEFPDFDAKPFVYVSLGGSVYRKQSYEDLIAALAPRSDWNVLLSLGPNFARSEFHGDHPHLQIRPFVPGLKACGYASVVINTGGHGTVMQALWHGRPVVALPHNIDQATIANRLVELGAGLNLTKIGIREFSDRSSYYRRATQTDWRDVLKATEAALRNGRMQRRAQALGRQLHKFGDGANLAADLIERYARKQ